jgi:uncharacterized protein (TIGR00251 family)
MGALRVTVRVKPGSSRTAVGGTYGDGQLVVAVNAPPVEGAANKAVVEAVASAFGLRRSDVALVAGQTGRTKIIELAGDADLLAARLRGLLGE